MFWVGVAVGLGVGVVGALVFVWFGGEILGRWLLRL